MPGSFPLRAQHSEGRFPITLFVQVEADDEQLLDVVLATRS